MVLVCKIICLPGGMERGVMDVVDMRAALLYWILPWVNHLVYCI